MSIKKMIKDAGKGFIVLGQETENMGGQSILMIDNGYTWIGYLCQAIEKIYDYFPNAEISVLTFEERKINLEKDFPKLKFIALSEKVWPKRYRVALQMLIMKRKRYDFVVLFSMDITPIAVSLLFFGQDIVLYNQWGQWWSLQLRNISQLFKSTYAGKKAMPGFKSLIKNIGLFFVLVQRRDEALFRHSILVVDNGRASYSQISHCIHRIKKSFPASNISMLASGQRKELVSHLSGVEIINPQNLFLKKYAIACHMAGLRKDRYAYIVLLSLDITPVIAALFFMKTKVMLFNRWEQWWSLKLKPIRMYLYAIPKLFFNIIIFVYLLVSVSCIFMKRLFNVFRKGLLWKSM